MILITGASAGIGEATARACAEKRQDLILLARRKERLETLASSLRASYGVAVHPFVVDIRKRAEIRAFAETQGALLDRVRVLVNNAGLARGLDPLQEGSIENWDEMIDTNLRGLLMITREVLPFLLKNGEGHIVNLGSVAGHHTYPKGNVYCATKWAVHALSESLRLDLNGTGIRVTEISPGMVETEFSRVRFEDQIRARDVYAGMTPLTAKDIAEAVLWAVERPPHVNIQEIILYPTDQASPTLIHRRNITR